MSHLPPIEVKLPTIQTPIKLRQYFADSVRRGKCVRCFLIQQYCICQELVNLRTFGDSDRSKKLDHEIKQVDQINESDDDDDGVKIEIFILMHLKGTPHLFTEILHLNFINLISIFINTIEQMFNFVFILNLTDCRAIQSIEYRKDNPFDL